jgi:hypothetical protein
MLKTDITNSWGLREAWSNNERTAHQAPRPCSKSNGNSIVQRASYMLRWAIILYGQCQFSPHDQKSKADPDSWLMRHHSAYPLRLARICEHNTRQGTTSLPHYSRTLYTESSMMCEAKAFEHKQARSSLLLPKTNI